MNEASDTHVNDRLARRRKSGTELLACSFQDTNSPLECEVVSHGEDGPLIRRRERGYVHPAVGVGGQRVLRGLVDDREQCLHFSLTRHVEGLLHPTRRDAGLYTFGLPLAACGSTCRRTWGLALQPFEFGHPTVRWVSRPTAYPSRV